MAIFSHRSAISAIITLFVVQGPQVTEGTVTANTVKGPVGGVTQWEAATQRHSLAHPMAGVPNEMSTRTMHDAKPLANQMNEIDRSSKQSGYVTITNNPGPLAKIFLDLFGFSQNSVQVPVSVNLEFSSNLSRVSPNDTLHEERGNAVDLFMYNRQNAASTIIKAVAPTVKVDQTNKTSAFVENELKATNLGSTPIRPWVWIFGISSLVVALGVMTIVRLRMSATHGTARQADDSPSSTDEQSNNRQGSQGTTVLYLQNIAAPISQETGPPSGQLNHNIHVFSDHYSVRTDAFQNPRNDLKVVAESIAGDGQPTSDPTNQ